MNPGIIRHLVETAQGKHPLRVKRSPEWHRLAKAHVKKIGECEGCGYKHFLQVHHIIPFHLRPDLELLEWNWIVLCEPLHRVRKCHILLGHGGNFKWFNPDVRAFAERYRAMVEEARSGRAHELAMKKAA